MCVENVFMICYGIITDTLSIDELTEFISMLIHICIDIVNIINCGKVRYLTPQLRVTVVKALKSIPATVCTLSLITGSLFLK